MSGQGNTPSGESDRDRRRRLEEVFGETLPETTSDERDVDPREGDSDDREAWLRRQVPPHHG